MFNSGIPILDGSKFCPSCGVKHNQDKCSLCILKLEFVEAMDEIGNAMKQLCIHVKAYENSIKVVRDVIKTNQ